MNPSNCYLLYNKHTNRLEAMFYDEQVANDYCDSRYCYFITKRIKLLGVS